MRTESSLSGPALAARDALLVPDVLGLDLGPDPAQHGLAQPAGLGASPVVYLDCHLRRYPAAGQLPAVQSQHVEGDGAEAAQRRCPARVLDVEAVGGRSG